MGCDIHTMIEYEHFTNQDGSIYWSSFNRGSFDPGRDCSMFEIINGVRGGGDDSGLFPKGALPDDIGYEARDYYFGQTEDGVTLEGPELGPDLHSPTWLTYEELAQVIAKRMFNSEWGAYSVGWDAILAAMRAFAEREVRTRLLVAYDN